MAKLSRVWTRRAADQMGLASYGHVVEFQAIAVYTGNKDGRGDKHRGHRHNKSV